MKILPSLLAVFFLFPLNAVVSADSGNTGIQGKWITADNATVVVAPCSGGLCGKVVKFQVPEGQDMATVKDVNNEDKSKRGRNVLGLDILYNLKPAGDNTWKGNVYDPNRGMDAAATVTLEQNGQLKLTGCKTVLVEVCKSENWRRIQ